MSITTTFEVTLTIEASAVTPEKERAARDLLGAYAFWAREGGGRARRLHPARQQSDYRQLRHGIAHPLR